MAAHRNYLAAAVVCAAALVGVTGCSSDDDKRPFDGMSADDIAEKASKATSGAKSLKIDIKSTENGQKSEVSYEVAGTGVCRGTMDMADVGKVELIAVDKASYTRGGDAYRERVLGSPEAAKKTKGKWLKAPEEQAARTCDLDAMFKASDLKGAERGDDSEANGKKTATLVKDGAAGEKVTYHIATEGEPYFVKIDSKGGSGPTTLTLSDFGKKFQVTAPPADQIEDPKDVIKGS
ncbi:hypothetical protein U9R90_11315 [Streptomyces sp. E11-3]|uniref:hypothetical protein n=1 Tax=Streptomyces sp. E11-3 TaxID=3110112 RepID=UPI0039800B8D